MDAVVQLFLHVSDIFRKKHTRWNEIRDWIWLYDIVQQRQTLPGTTMYNQGMMCILMGTTMSPPLCHLVIMFNIIYWTWNMWSFFFLNMKHRYWSLWPMILKYILRYNDDIPSNAYINMDWFKGNSTGNHKKKIPFRSWGFPVNIVP